MADDIVEIVIDIIDSFSDDIARLRAQLEAIDAKDIDINADISESGFEQVMAKKSMLSKDMDSTLHFTTAGSPLSGARAPQEAVKETVERQIRDMRDVNLFPGTDAFDAIENVGRQQIPGGRGTIDTTRFGQFATLPGRTRRAGVTSDFLDSVRRVRSVTSGALAGAPGALAGGNVTRKLNIKDKIEESGQAMSRLRGIVQRLTPNMMQLWNILAAAIPIIVALTGALLGLVGAVVALGSAGAAIGGIGLLGFGDDMQESIARVQEQIGLLKEQLFEAVQPAAMAFQPIVEDFLRALPGAATELAGPLREMAVFADELANAGRGILEWVTEVIEAMASMDDAVGVIASSFGSAFGNFLIDLMSNMTMFAAQNRDMLIETASAVADLFRMLFDLSVIVTRVLALFQPLISVLERLTGLLNNPVTSAILAATALMIGLEVVVSKLMGAYLALTAANGLLQSSLRAQIGLIASRYIPMLKFLALEIWSVVAASRALQAALVATGIGALAVGGGMLLNQMRAQPVPETNSGTTVTNINIEGDAGRRETDRILDKVGTETRNEVSLMDSQEA